MEELFLAVFFNDLEKVKNFKSQYPELYAKRESYLINGYTYIDLTNLTFFNQAIWNDNWNEEIMPFVKKNREQTKLMMDFWKMEMNSKELNKKIEYNKYFDYFFCDNPNDPDDNGTVICDPISFFLEKGFREIDIRLYNRVECFDFTETENLLKQGAKSNINLYKDEDSNAYSRISNECSFIATTFIIPEFQIFKKKGYNQDFDITSMFGDLIGLAAHEAMLELLEKYCDKK